MSPRLKYYDPADESVLRRIEFFTGDWERLNWYVKFAKRNVGGPGELPKCQDEVVALLRTLSPSAFANPARPKPDALARFQETIARHLQNLVDDHRTQFRPFTITIDITLPQARQAQPDWLPDFLGQTERTASAYLPKTPATLALPKSDWPAHLLYHFARLLEAMGSSIKRCPFCSQVFLQLRRSRVYCSPKHQKRAFMRRDRAAKKKAKARGKRKGRKARAASKQRGSRHGRRAR